MQSKTAKKIEKISKSVRSTTRGAKKQLQQKPNQTQRFRVNENENLVLDLFFAFL
jgi:hypothetical protein